jgi:Na+-transporting NADH:ubiquinone oxidoreductase subunit F
MTELAFAVLLFMAIIMTLSLLIVGIRSVLIVSGEVQVTVNDERVLPVTVGKKLLDALAYHNLFLPSACGGRGTCGQCRVRVLEGGGPLLPTETALISRKQAAAHQRLACQLAVNGPLRVRIPVEILGVKQYTCVVTTTRSVATYIKELVLSLPPEETFDFRAGTYIQVHCPPNDVRFADFEIDERFRPEWDRLDLWRLESHSRKSETRAYSLANYPGESNQLILNVRIATPPAGASRKIPPGIVSTYLFGLEAGDQVAISGPYGDFLAKDTENEMIFIGGGAGMAPMRSHILDQLMRVHTRRKITFWYGARSRNELFYVDLFDRLQAEFDNFEWHIALSDPRFSDDWQGPTGFIHQFVYDHYLRNHENPEECEYYICGPPLMSVAAITMLKDLGVEDDNILLDDFGSAGT